MLWFYSIRIDWLISFLDHTLELNIESINVIFYVCFDMTIKGDLVLIKLLATFSQL
jgi:hypothetical protein